MNRGRSGPRVAAAAATLGFVTQPLWGCLNRPFLTPSNRPGATPRVRTLERHDLRHAVDRGTLRLRALSLRRIDLLQFYQFQRDARRRPILESVAQHTRLRRALYRRRADYFARTRIADEFGAARSDNLQRDLLPAASRSNSSLVDRLAVDFQRAIWIDERRP